MRRAWLKIGVVALACTVAIAVLQSPAPQRRTMAVNAREVSPRGTAITPTALRAERNDETPTRIQEQATAHAIALRKEETLRQAAQEAVPPARVLVSYGGPAAAAAMPATQMERWERFRLRPGLILHIQTNGRPCTVRTDATMDVFPNNPSLAHRIVGAGSALRFPLQRGQGPMSIHASPLRGAYGTLELRYDD
jgi:hypothetical protein